MAHEIGTRHVGMIALGAGALAAAIYMVMIRVTLAHLTVVSGLTPFDMRPMGYGPAEATALLEGLGPEGRAYYLSRQIPLDLMYPVLLAAVLVATICWCGRRLGGWRLLRLGMVAAVGAALFDYGENLGVAAMIWGWPGVSEPLVFATSAATIAKSVLTMVAVVVAMGALAAVLIRRAWR